MEGRKLPVGWALSEIGGLCELRNGRAFKSTDWQEAGIPIVRIQNLNNPEAKYNYFQGEIDDRNRLRGGELLFAWSGTPGTSFGAHVWNGGEAVLNQHIFRVDFDENLVDKQFFRFAINQKLSELIDNAHGGVGLRHVTKGKFEKTKVTIPPFNEQRRIAAKLDTTLAAVEACRQRLDGVAVILKRIRQAVLAAATSGELTREWREGNPIDEDTGGNEVASLIEKWISSQLHGKAKIPAEPDLRFWTALIPQSWHLGSVSMFAECLDNQRIPVKKDKRNAVQGTYPYYGANGIVDMVDEYIFDGELVLVTEDETFYGREKPIAYRSSGKCWVNNHAHVLRPEDAVAADYLCYCLMHYPVLPWLTGTTGRAKLTQGVLNSLPVAIPPRIEMERIVSKVQELFSLADQLEAKLATARKIVECLTPALLAKAFRGELVPQDPSDEPASVLLDRIRAARQAEAAAGKPSRRGGRKAAAHPEQIPLPAAPAPPDLLAQLLMECGALSERALLAASELDPAGFRAQLALEQGMGVIRETALDGQVLLEAVG